MRNWLREIIEQLRAELEKPLPMLVERCDDHVAEILSRGVRRLAAADRMTQFWCGLFVVGVFVVVIANAVPIIHDAGNGYFLRAGILLGGAALAKLLNPGYSRHG